MNKRQLTVIHEELNAAIDAVLEKHGFEHLPGTLTYDGDGFRLPIKATRSVTLQTALTAPDRVIKAGLARPGTKAKVFDSRGAQAYRDVIITEAKVKKYSFYFADDPQKRSMIGHFGLFSSTE